MIQNKSMQGYKSILIRIKKDKREARLNKMSIIDNKNMVESDNSNFGR